jgi:hypothetical protein
MLTLDAPMGMLSLLAFVNGKVDALCCQPNIFSSLLSNATYLLLPTTKPVVLLVVTVQITSSINMSESYFLILFP